MAFPSESLPGLSNSVLSSGSHLGRQALLQPEGGGRSAARWPPVDAPEPQQVEQDGEQDHQEAAREQVVIVDKGEAPPVRVTGPEGLLLDVSGHRETKNKQDESGKERDVLAHRVRVGGTGFRARL